MHLCTTVLQVCAQVLCTFGRLRQQQVMLNACTRYSRHCAAAYISYKESITQVTVSLLSARLNHLCVQEIPTLSRFLSNIVHNGVGVKNDYTQNDTLHHSFVWLLCLMYSQKSYRYIFHFGFCLNVQTKNNRTRNFIVFSCEIMFVWCHVSHTAISIVMELCRWIDDSLSFVNSTPNWMISTNFLRNTLQSVWNTFSQKNAIESRFSWYILVCILCYAQWPTRWPLESMD